MAQPPSNQSVNPTDITTKLTGKPQRADSADLIIRDLQTRVKDLENSALPLGKNQSRGTGAGFVAVAGGVAVITGIPITVVNPVGAWVQITGCVSGYSPVASSITQLYYQLDGGTWLVSGNQISNFFWNVANQHLTLPAWDFMIFLTPGPHSIAINANCSAGSWSRDGNDYASLSLVELP